MYKLFHKAAPSGKMGKPEFKKYIEDLALFKKVDQNEEYDQLFRGYDRDRDGVCCYFMVGAGKFVFFVLLRLLRRGELPGTAHPHTHTHTHTPQTISFKEYLQYHLGIVFSTEELFDSMSARTPRHTPLPPHTPPHPTQLSSPCTTPTTTATSHAKSWRRW